MCAPPCYPADGPQRNHVCVCERDKSETYRDTRYFGRWKWVGNNKRNTAAVTMISMIGISFNYETTEYVVYTKRRYMSCTHRICDFERKKRLLFESSPEHSAADAERPITCLASRRRGNALFFFQRPAHVHGFLAPSYRRHGNQAPLPRIRLNISVFIYVCLIFFAPRPPGVSFPIRVWDVSLWRLSVLVDLLLTP